MTTATRNMDGVKIGFGAYGVVTYTPDVDYVRAPALQLMDTRVPTPTAKAIYEELWPYLRDDLHLGGVDFKLTWQKIETPERAAYRKQYPNAAFVPPEGMRDPDHHYGATKGFGDVRVRCDLAPLDIIETLAHELRHVWQNQQFVDEKSELALDHNAAERDAFEYGQSIRRAMMGKAA